MGGPAEYVSSISQVQVQTHMKALNAGVMSELLLCTWAYSAGACDHLDSGSKNHARVWGVNFFVGGCSSYTNEIGLPS